MKRTALLAMVVSTALAGSALADKSDKAEKTDKADKNAAAKGPKPAKMTCQEFIELDDVAKPKVVYWAEGYDRKGRPDDAVVDVETTDRLVPVLVEECKVTPKEPFWKKVKQEFKKVF